MPTHSQSCRNKTSAAPHTNAWAAHGDDGSRDVCVGEMASSVRRKEEALWREGHRLVSISTETQQKKWTWTTSGGVQFSKSKRVGSKARWLRKRVFLTGELGASVLRMPGLAQLSVLCSVSWLDKHILLVGQARQVGKVESPGTWSMDVSA